MSFERNYENSIPHEEINEEEEFYSLNEILEEAIEYKLAEEEYKWEEIIAADRRRFD